LISERSDNKIIKESIAPDARAEIFSPEKEEKGAKILSSTDDHRHYHLRSFITASTSHGQRDCGQFEKEIYIRCHRFAWQQDFNQHMHT